MFKVARAAAKYHLPHIDAEFRRVCQIAAKRLGVKNG
jgi:hypothetical protein